MDKFAMSRSKMQDVMERRLQAAKATTGRMLAEKHAVEREAYNPRESSRDSSRRPKQSPVFSEEDEPIKQKSIMKRSAPIVPTQAAPTQVAPTQVAPNVPAFSPVVAPIQQTPPTQSQPQNQTLSTQEVSTVDEEKREKSTRGRPKKKEEPVEEEKQVIIHQKERESKREREQSDDEGINLDDDDEEDLLSSSEEEEEYEEERSSRRRSSTPTPGSIPRSQMMKLLKSADVQSLSSDCLDTAFDTLGAIIEDCIKPDAMLASSDVLQFVQYHFNFGEDDLPEDVILPPTVFKDFAMPFFKEKKAGFRRDAIMLLHLFAEAMIRKITIAADMIASVCKRKIIKGEDFTVAFTIYSM